MSAGDGYKLTGARLAELIIAVVFSGIISGGMTGYIAVRVLENDLQHLRASHDELKRELWQMRRDFYRPPHWVPEEGGMQLDLPGLIDDLRHSLGTSAKYFQGTQEDEDLDLRRLIQVAAADLADKRGRTLVGEVELAAGQWRYEDLPADLLYIKLPLWGSDRKVSPWADNYPGPLPRARTARENGNTVLFLSPSPSQLQIDTLGREYRFYYAASYWSGDPNDPIDLESPADKNLIMLRAQAEAMRELAMQNISRPVETRTSISMPANATAGAIWERLMAEYRRQVGAGAEA